MKSLREYLNIIEQINESPMPMVGGVEFAEQDDDTNAMSLADLTDIEAIGGDAADNLIADVDTDERTMQENDSDDRTPAKQLQSMILHRIMMQHPDLLRQHGPAAVMDAAQDEAEAYGEYEEMGTSDISNLVNNVARSLGQD
jgi:hypothetical protein